MRLTWQTALMIWLLFVSGWWGLGALALGLGYKQKDSAKGIGTEAAFAALVATLFQDQDSKFLISKRVAAAFNLPMSWMIYLVMALLAYVTAYLAYQAGATIFPKRKTESNPAT